MVEGSSSRKLLMTLSEALQSIINRINAHTEKYSFLRDMSQKNVVSKEYFFENQVEVKNLSLAIASSSTKEYSSSLFFFYAKGGDNFTSMCEFIEKMQDIFDWINPSLDHMNIYDSDMRLFVDPPTIFESDENYAAEFKLKIIL
jgi:hypothetical protein